MGKKKAAPASGAAAAAGAVVVDVSPPAFTTAEAKKLAKLLKASDRRKRLDAIQVVSENHGYIATGNCLLPLLESMVAKKKMEEVIKASSQVVVDYFIGRTDGNPTLASDTTLAAMQEAKKKSAKYKMAEVLGNLVLDPDRGNSWNAVRSLRSMAAVLASLSEDSAHAASLGAILLGSGQPVERLCSYFVAQEKQRVNIARPEEPEEKKDPGVDPAIPWVVVRLHILDTLGVMCGLSDAAIQTVVASGSVPYLLGVLRSITESESSDLAILTPILMIICDVAKAGSGITTARGGSGGSGVAGGSIPPPELAALAEGGAWGAVYDALKGPCMARAATLQSSTSGGKKGEVPSLADLTACLDNMARCVEVLRVMAMTGAGLEEEGSLEAGVAAMSSILGMQGLPREQAAVANLMTGIVKAMGSIACLSESNRVKVCSAGAAARVLTLLAPSDPPASTGIPSPLDTPQSRLMRKTAEKCLHHLVVSRVTWMADDRALCDTSASSIPEDPDGGKTNMKGVRVGLGAEAATDKRRSSVNINNNNRSSKRRSRASQAEDMHPPQALGPAYLTVDAVLEAANADSIDVRCRAIRLLSRLMTSRRCAATLGVSVVPALGRLIAWWLRTKDDPEANRTPRPPESAPPETGKLAVAGKKEAAAAGKAPAAEGVAANNEQTDADKAALLDAQLTTKRLEESDSTRVLRDEALAYALSVMRETAETSREGRVAIGKDHIAGLLVNVLKRLPCTAEEFFANSGRRLSITTNGKSCSETPTPSSVTAVYTKIPSAGEKSTAKSAEKGAGDGGMQHSPSNVKSSGFLDSSVLATHRCSSSKPDTTLDLSSTRCSWSSSSSPRRVFCWRGAKSRDPEVALFSPLDWDWDFEVGVFQEPVQPGLVLRAAALRVLLTVANGYDPAIEAAARLEATTLASPTKPKGGVAAAGATEASAQSGADGARSVLKNALTVCIDLLSVDVRHGEEHNDEINYDCEAHSTIDQCVAGKKTGAHQYPRIHPDGKPVKLTIDVMSGLPVGPSEELVHEEIRVACLRLLGSLLRLGSIAREAFLSAADTHRNHWRILLEKAHRPSTQPGPLLNLNKSGATADKGSGKIEGEGGTEVSWVKPDMFCRWEFHGSGQLQSLREALPYVRIISIFLVPLQNPDAPVTNIMAALVALKWLCREGEHEVGGTTPVLPLTDDDTATPLPLSKDGTTGALADTLAGVAVSMGVLVPLVTIWGCAVAAAGSGELPLETMGMVKECQVLIDYLIRRGHARESFWSSVRSLEQIAEAKAAAVEAAAQKKAQRKSKGGGKGSKSDKGSAAAVLPENDQLQEPGLSPASTPPAGRPDPNSGPDRATWGALLNAHVDEHRTQTYGATALLMATITGLETAISSLLLAGADPNMRGNDGRSSLMCALAQGMDMAVRGLVEAGADVDAVDLQGSNVLKCAFLCPSRRTMQHIMQKHPDARAEALPTGSGSSRVEACSSTGRRDSSTRTDLSSAEGGAPLGRPRSRSRKTSLSTSRSRSRSRSGSLSKERRRSSLGHSVFFSERNVIAAAVGGPGECRRPSLTSSMSGTDSARAAFRDSARRESMRPLKTPRGTIVVRGDARMVPYILACGADPNVSSGMGDFPLHWAVIGTETSVRIMNQHVKIVNGGGVFAVDSVSSRGGNCIQTNHSVGEKSTSLNEKVTKAGNQTVVNEEDLSLLKVLVKAGSALDSCDPQGLTALHAAVIASRGTFAGALLDAGASPNISDSLGCLPLHYACLRATSGFADLASRLLDLGMGRPLDKGVHRDLRKGKSRREKLLLDVGDIMRSGLREATAPASITQHRATRPELLNFVSAEGFTPLHYVCDGRVTGRHVAATILTLLQGRVSVVESLPADGGEVGAPSMDVSDTGGVSDDDILANESVDRVKILKWLLLEPELDTKVRVPRGATTLHLAAQKSGSQGGDLIRSLIQAGGVNFDALDVPAAISSGNTSIDKLVNTKSPGRASGTPPFVGSSGIAGGGDDTMFRFSALHYALHAGSWEAATLLLTAGAKVQPEGAFPPCLHVACRAGAPASLVEKLIKGVECSATLPARQPGMAGDIVGKDDLVILAVPAEAGLYTATPLFLAAAAGSVGLIELLLSMYSANTTMAVGTAGKGTPSTTGEGGKGSAIDNPETIWSMAHSPSDGRSPLHAAAFGGHTAAAKALLDRETTCVLNGSPPLSWLNALDAKGCIPLDLAVSKGNWECARLLASADRFDIRLVVEGGTSSALITAERSNMNIVDEGSGEASALSDLRKSNTLIMILLRRLSTIPRAGQAVVAAAGINVAGGSAEGGHPVASNDKKEVNNEVVVSSGENLGSLPPVQSDTERTRPGDMVTSPLVLRLPHTIYHLHPCFAEGVLYSNAKGIFIPDTPGRRKRRLSQSFSSSNVTDKSLAVAENTTADQSRAAVIIQSQARQAEARRVVTAKRAGMESTHLSSAGAIHSNNPAPNVVSLATDEGRVDVVTQPKERQAKARAEVTRQREQAEDKNRNCGDVEAVAGTKVQTRQTGELHVGGGG